MQKMITLMAIWIFIVISITSCNNEKTTTTPLATTQNEDAMLDLTIQFDSPSFKIGDAVPIKLILSNLGDESVLVNGRMAPNFSYAPEKFREILFKIESPSGRELELSMLINVRSPKPDDFILLEAGESIERVIDLSFIYSFAVSGEYSIQAIYQNASDPGDGQETWKGEIESNTVTFILEE